MKEERRVSNVKQRVILLQRYTGHELKKMCLSFLRTAMEETNEKVCIKYVFKNQMRSQQYLSILVLRILMTIPIIHVSNHSNFEHLWPCIYVTFRLLGAKCRIVHDKSLMVEWFTCWKDIKLLLTSHPVKSKTTFSFYLLHICRYVSCGLRHSHWPNNWDFLKPSKGVYPIKLAST